MKLADLETALLRIIEERIPDELLRALDREGFGIVAAECPPEGPGRVAGRCVHELRTIFIYAAGMGGADHEIEFVLRHEIAHALGFHHGEKMEEIEGEQRVFLGYPRQG